MKSLNHLTRALTVLTLFAVLTGCGTKDNDSTGPNTSPYQPDTNGTEGTTDATNEPEKINDEGKLTAAHEAVKEMMGDHYLPDLALRVNELEEIYGINPTHVKSFIAQVPMLSMHADIFLGIEAHDGKVGDVEKALNEYRDYLINESVQYPVNKAKVNASKVLVIRNHAFLLLLGPGVDGFEKTPEELSDIANTEMEKVIETIETVFNK